MNTKVIMVRHGETEWNVLCKFLGSADIPLNEKGRRQAGYTKEALKDTQIDVIYSSPMLRAYETGVIIKGDRDVAVMKDDELREIGCGKWEGLDGNEVEERFQGQIYLWGNRPEDCRIEGGDTFQEVSDRIIQAFWRIVRENRGKTILITSHMICLTLLMLHFEGKRINEMWNVKPIGNAALNMIEVSGDDKVTITVWSDDSFVPEEDKKGSALVAGGDYVEE